jgi:zinc transporter 1
VHVVVSEDSVEDFIKIAKVINGCFHAYGIHSVTLQPELSDDGAEADVTQDSDKSSRCQVICGTLCEQLTCCG